MAAFLNFQLVLREEGTNVAVIRADRGQGVIDVHIRQHQGQLLQLRQIAADLFQQIGKQLGFQTNGALLRMQDRVFLFFQLGGDVALGVGQRLLADIAVFFLHLC